MSNAGRYDCETGLLACEGMSLITCYAAKPWNGVLEVGNFSRPLC
jgi:hypothetical protein